MAKKEYKIVSQEGADKYGGEVGEVKELELEQTEETAVVAAGWVEPDTKKKG